MLTDGVYLLSDVIVTGERRRATTPRNCEHHRGTPTLVQSPDITGRHPLSSKLRTSPRDAHTRPISGHHWETPTLVQTPDITGRHPLSYKLRTSLIQAYTPQTPGTTRLTHSSKLRSPNIIEGHLHSTVHRLDTGRRCPHSSRPRRHH